VVVKVPEREGTKMAEHYYTEKQSSAFRPQKVMMRAAGREIELYTAGGVFSPKKLDLGSKLLIDAAVVKKGWRILDFGCGYGVVGVMIKRMNPSVDVVMSDVNSRGVRLAKMNAKLHKLDIDVVQSDVFKNSRLSKMCFDTILLNPPQTAGKELCFRMIEESWGHLVPGGLLQIVARSQKGGKQLSKKMEEVFGSVEESAKKSGFRVYVSKKEE
jgi:16S rRNA G1207 methylase RsmC